jgi:PAS domain S-box-containing protein
MKGGEATTFDTNLEGVLMTGALASSNVSGWAVGLEVPTEILDAPFHRSLIELLGIASVLAVAGALLAQLIVRRIERSIASLSHAAESLNCGLPPVTRAAGIREIEQVGTALADAAELLRERSTERDVALERLHLAVTASLMGVFDWTLRTDTFLWSGECYRMLGYKIGEVEPSHAVWMARIHPDDREAAEAAETRARLEHKEFINEYRIIRRDGSVRWVLARGRFLYDADKPVRMIGLTQDITEARQQIETQRVLVAELQHRTRNLIAVVQSIADQTLDTVDSLGEFESRFNNRLEALSRVQSLLSRADNEPITLGALVVMELEALSSDAFGNRITVGGPETPLRKSAVEMLALAIHELLTNAIKYGALAGTTGRLSVSWRIEGTPPDRRLVLEWIERGIASLPSADARQSGFGRTLIEEALPYSLAAETKFELGSDMLRCVISLPLATNSADEMLG